MYLHIYIYTFVSDNYVTSGSVFGHDLFSIDVFAYTIVSFPAFLLSPWTPRGVRGRTGAHEDPRLGAGLDCWVTQDSARQS